MSDTMLWRATGLLLLVLLAALLLAGCSRAPGPAEAVGQLRPDLGTVVQAPIDADADGLPDFLDPDDANPDTDGDRILDSYEATWYAARGETDWLQPVYDNTRKPPLGDANGDGHVSNLDAYMIQTRFLGLVPNQAQPLDLNRDGQISNLDALLALRFSLGLVEVLPR